MILLRPPTPEPSFTGPCTQPTGPPHLASRLEYCGHGHPTSTLGTLSRAHSSQVMVTPRWLPPSEPCCSPPGHPCFHLPPLSPPQPHQPPVAQGPAPPVPTYLLLLCLNRLHLGDSAWPSLFAEATLPCPPLLFVPPAGQQLQEEKDFGQQVTMTVLLGFCRKLPSEPGAVDRSEVLDSGMFWLQV